jgi:5'-nucleotidase/UDP-sugar diphosphatase
MNPAMLARRTLVGFLGTLPLVRVAHAEPAGGQAAHRLTIIHLNDFHSRHDPVNPGTLACTTGDGCFGGSPHLATAIALQRRAAEADGRAVLLLDGGDQFQGSLFYTALHGDVELAVMHAIGTEAMAVGNHEFDNGPANLARFVKAARFPVLSANIEAAQFVVALSHLGLGADHALAAPGIDVIIGGHSHSLLSNVELGAVGPFPSVEGKTLIVQAGAYGRYLGRLDLDVAADGTLLAWGGECRHVGLDLTPDPAVAAIVASYAAPLEATRRHVVGHADAALDIGRCRFSECALGDLVADAILAGDHGAEVALMNAGGIRTGLPAGDITLGDVIGMLPFGNTLATCKLKGSDLHAAVLHGLTMIGRGGFLQTAGLQVVWSPLAPSQTAVLVREPDGRFVPIDPDRLYHVATNNFMRGGGDGYTVLRDAAIDPYDTGPGLDDLVADRITALSPLRLATEGRLTMR